MSCSMPSLDLPLALVETHQASPGVFWGLANFLSNCNITYFQYSGYGLRNSFQMFSKMCPQIGGVTNQCKKVYNFWMFLVPFIIHTFIVSIKQGNMII